MKRNLLTIMLAFFVVFAVNAQKNFLAEQNGMTEKELDVKGIHNSHNKVVKGYTFSSKGYAINENFDAAVPPAGWANFQNGAGSKVWESSTTNVVSGSSAKAGWENSGGDNEQWLVTPALSISAGQNVLSFYTCDDFGSNYGSSLVVKYSTTDQTTVADFTDLLTLTEADVTNDLMEEHTIDLSAYDGQTIYIAFVMYDNDGDSWYLDDVVIGTPDPHDLGVEAISPSYLVESGSTVTPQVTVRNYGTSDETTWSVQLTDGSGYDETVSDAATITAGSDYVVDFPDWTPADGTYTLTATVTVSGDANASNNTNTSDVEVRALEFGDVVNVFPADASGCPGIETDGNFIYTAFWSAANSGRYFSRYQMDGTFVEDFQITGVQDVRDMAYNPNTGYFYGAAANTSLFEMDFTQGSEALVNTITAATDCRALAYDDGDDTFWGNNWDSPFTEFDNTGTATGNTMTVTSIYGAAYDMWTDSLNPTMWVFSSDGGSPANSLIEYEMDGTLTGRTIDISTVPGYDAGFGGGLASFVADNKAYLLANIQQNPNLIVQIFLKQLPSTSVNNISEESINVYPNPSNGQFTINVDNNYNLEVFDITGRVINTRTLSGNTSIELNSAGVYFLRFSNEKGSYTQKVIVQ